MINNVNMTPNYDVIAKIFSEVQDNDNKIKASINLSAKRITSLSMGLEKIELRKNIIGKKVRFVKDYQAGSVSRCYSKGVTGKIRKIYGDKHVDLTINGYETDWIPVEVLEIVK